MISQIYKTKIGTNYTKYYDDFNLSDNQYQVILGTLLGDANLGVPTGGKNPRIEISHTVDNVRYIDWKYDILKSSGLIKHKVNGYNSSIKFKDGTIKLYPSLRLYTMCHPYLWEFANLIYPNGFGKNYKRISWDVLNLLKPLGVAVWLGDDGHLSFKNYILSLHTERYSLEENNIVSKWFLLNYGININVHIKKSPQHNFYYLHMGNRHNIQSFLDQLNPLPPSRNLIFD